jgi:transketolase
MNNDELAGIARQIRLDALFEVHSAKSGHLGGSFSAADILAILYFEEMNIPDFGDEKRDRFVLSKGHAAPALYSALCQKGAFGREELSTLRALGSRLQGHPDPRKLPGVEAATGSLGLGFSAAVGMALAAKAASASWRTYALLGDGELEEGIVWEAFMAASHYGLASLTAVVDNNGLQIDGPVDEVMSPYPICEKAEAFGWDAFACDGHSFDSLRSALKKARGSSKPSLVVAKTAKGKGVSFMEGQVSWHGKATTQEQYDSALRELQA